MATKLPEIRGILSRNLKEQRKKIGYSQEKLAEVSGLSVQTINDIEGGRKWVSDKTITKLSTTLNIECYQLLMPDYVIQNKGEATSPRKILGLMKKLQKSVSTQIDEQFTDFLKSDVSK